MEYLLVVAVLLTTSFLVNVMGENDGAYLNYFVFYGNVCYDEKNDAESGCFTRNPSLSEPNEDSIISEMFINDTDGSRYYFTFCCANMDYDPIISNDDEIAMAVSCDTLGTSCSDQGLISTRDLTPQPTAAPVIAPTPVPTGVTDEPFCVGSGCKEITKGVTFWKSTYSSSGLANHIPIYLCCPAANESRIDVQWESDIIVGSCFVPNDRSTTCPADTSATKAYDWEGGDGYRPTITFPREDDDVAKEGLTIAIVTLCIIGLVIICLVGTLMWFCYLKPKKTATNDDPMSAAPLKSQDPVVV